MTRNPTVQQQQELAVRKADPALKEFNADEEYSLLKCPKPYTLLVKEYMGATTIENSSGKGDGGFLGVFGLGGKKPGEALDAAAKQAHETARALRQLHFDAYVLHTRHRAALSPSAALRGRMTPLCKQ